MKLTCTRTPSVLVALKVTPLLHGTILPGMMRASVLSLLSHHPHMTMLPHLPPTLHLHAAECTLTMSKLFVASVSSMLREVICIGTMAVIIPAMHIGWQRQCHCVGSTEAEADGETTQV